MAKNKASCRYLGLDLSTSPGFAVIDVKNDKPTLVTATSIATDTRNTDSERYAYIEAKAVMVVHEYAPFDEVIREDYTRGRNKRALQTVYGSWAAVDGALGRYGYAVTAHITPTEVKQLVGGDGRADKDAVADGARRLLRLGTDYMFKSDDASDAAAVVLAWLLREKIIEEAEG